jgi:hypothetical protein
MTESLSTYILLISSSDIDTDLHVAEDQMTLSPHPSSGVFHEPFRSLKNAGPWKRRSRNSSPVRLTRGQHLSWLDHSGACREAAAIPSSEFLHILKNRQILIPWIFPILCQK